MPVAYRDARRVKRVPWSPDRTRGATLVMRSRGLLAGLTALLLGMSAGSPQIVAAFGSTRTISMYHIHTKETITITYKRDGKYIASALKKLNWFLRDWRENEEIAIDPKAIDLLWEMHTELGSKKPIHIICGYRSEKTNGMLRKTRGGQAKKSYHIRGKAIDAAFPDIPVKQMRYSALIRERGGVGYYPTSGIPFVHVDTGRVRAWPRLPRYELALLFPNGHTKHRPKSGGPITRKDVQIARARHKTTASQVATFFDLRNKPKTPVTVAEAAPQPPTPKPPTRIAALEPAAAPAPPRLLSAPQLVRASATPSADERGRLDELVQLASLPAPAPRTTTTPRLATASAGDGLGALIAASAAADLPTPPPQEQARARGARDEGVRVASLDGSIPAPPRQEQGWSNGWAPAPEFDDDHPEELSYRPFPIAPFLTQSPSADDTALVELVHPDVMRTLELLDDHEVVLPLRMRAGRQVTEVMWAQQFRGNAIDAAVLEEAQRLRGGPASLASHAVRTTGR
jgi:uncharacterized protein YcbK (DUF882 family)